MELVKEIHENIERVLQERSDEILELKIRLECANESASRRRDLYILNLKTKVSTILESNNADYNGLLELLLLDPIRNEKKHLEIICNMEIKNWISPGIGLDYKGFQKLAHNLVRDKIIYERGAGRTIDTKNLIQQFEEYLFSRSVFYTIDSWYQYIFMQPSLRKIRKDITGYTHRFLSIYTKSLIDGLILLNSDPQNLKNQTYIIQSFKAIFENDHEQLKNYIRDVRKFYYVLKELKLIESNYETFYVTFNHLIIHHSLSSDLNKIKIDLKRSDLSTNELGYIFNYFKTHSYVKTNSNQESAFITIIIKGFEIFKKNNSIFNMHPRKSVRDLISRNKELNKKTHKNAEKINALLKSDVI